MCAHVSCQVPFTGGGAVVPGPTELQPSGFWYYNDSITCYHFMPYVDPAVGGDPGDKGIHAAS